MHFYISAKNAVIFLVIHKVHKLNLTKVKKKRGLIRHIVNGGRRKPEIQKWR